MLLLNCEQTVSYGEIGMEEKVIEFINEQKSKSRKFLIRELLINAVEIVILVIIVLKTMETNYLIPVMLIGVVIISSSTLLNIKSVFGSLKKFVDASNLSNIYNVPKQEYDLAMKKYDSGKISLEELQEIKDKLDKAVEELYGKLENE